MSRAEDRKPMSVLVVDDQGSMRRSLEMLLRMEGFDARSAVNGEEAVQIAAQSMLDVVVTDLCMIPTSGLDVLANIKRHSPHTQVIIMTAFATIDSAVTAMKMGAFDYIVKPFKNDVIVTKVRRAGEKARAMIDAPVKEAPYATGIPRTVVSQSSSMKHVLELVDKLAPTDLTVLITGDTGTGKTLVARLLHMKSSRAAKPFIAVNCAALPEALLESELFGHERGAFTGASGTHRGLFEEAHHGTLFLDEVGLLSLANQSKLLCAIEDRKIRRVGGSRFVPIDVRILAASNAPLTARVHNGEFRRDLFFRLSAAVIHIPPLFERREDISPLVEHILEGLRQQSGRDLTISPAAMEVLLAYDYPGNVRELENALQWAAAICGGAAIAPEHLPDHFREPPSAAFGGDFIVPATADLALLSEVTKQHILRSLERHRGNLTRTAKELGISRTTLWRKMKDYGLA
jgi:DNA-binding NtrC family response regulator